MIPRQIFKIWVGDNPQPKDFDKYIDSWQNSQCLIVPINNSDIELCYFETRSDFLKWAVDNKKWALVNHYLRYWLLFKNGGIYMDLDVQVIKTFPVFANCLHIGMESERWLNNCFMASNPGHTFFSDCMSFMETIDRNTKEIELETGPRLVTNMIAKYTDWKPHLMDSKELHEYKDNFVSIYPERYFSPHRWYENYTTSEITPDTITVHHYCHSWKPSEN